MTISRARVVVLAGIAATAAVPRSAYARMQLRNLDGSGCLRGKWAAVASSTGTPDYSTTTLQSLGFGSARVGWTTPRTPR